jgi:hypothetical protein
MGFAEGGAAEATGDSPCLPPILEDGAACPIFAIAVETGTTELLPLPLSSDAPGLDRKLSVRHAYDDCGISVEHVSEACDVSETQFVIESAQRGCFKRKPIDQQAFRHTVKNSVPIKPRRQ